MENRETVCAVVVTYNRKDLLIECLDELCKQNRPIEAMYIIDNFSNDGTAELLLENGYIKELPPKNLLEPFETEIDFDNCKLLSIFDDKIEYKQQKIESKIRIYYVRMNENTGGAGGFFEGLKRAYEKKYDWFWLMDDDGKADSNTLYELSIVASSNINYVASNLIDFKGVWHFQDKFNNKLDVINHIGGPFNSILLNRKIILECGFPMKSLFIWGDEFEYLNRIREKGFITATAKKSFFYHKRTSFSIKDKNPRIYFLVRNKIISYRVFRGLYRSKKANLLGTMMFILSLIISSIKNFALANTFYILKGLFAGIIFDIKQAKTIAYFDGYDIG